MNKNMKLYFDNHPGVDTFHFTSDGQAFSQKIQANPHEANLVKDKKAGGITAVTRAEINEWWKEQAPKEAAEAEKAVVDAEQAEDAAQTAVNALGKDTLPSKRMAASGALLKATTQLTKAQATLAAATAAAALVADKAEATADAETAAVPGTEEQAAVAAANLDKAKIAVDAAKKAQDELPADATPQQKGKITAALNKANRDMAEAQVAMDELAD